MRPLQTLLVAAIMLTPARPAAAQWSLQGTALDTRPGDHRQPRVAPDGAGGAYVVWSHADAASHVRVQHLTASGEPASSWSAGGAEVAPAGPARAILGSGPDGSGGLVVGWLEAGQAFAKRMLADGSPAAGWLAAGNAFWSPVSGGAEFNDHLTWFGADETGGAWFVRHVDTRICPDICYGSSTEEARHLAGSGIVESGGWYVASSGQPYGANLVRASTHAGSLLTLGLDDQGLSGHLKEVSIPTGLDWAAPIALQDLSGLGVADDAAGGALLVTEGGLGTAPPHVIRRDANGANAPGWPVDGVPFRVPDAPMSGVQAIGDGAGGVLIAWTETGGAGNELRVQRMTGAGVPSPGWPGAGVLLNDAPGAHDDLTLAADGTGGVFAAWSDRRLDADGDVYATHLLADGTRDPAFAANGSAVAVVPGAQGNLAVCAVSDGHAVLAWEDARNPAQRVVYAQLIPVPGVLDAPPTVPRGLALAGFMPNPARNVIQVEFRLPSTDDATLELFDIFGRSVSVEEFPATPAGEHRVTMPASSRLPAGLYLVRLRSGGQERTARGMFAR